MSTNDTPLDEQVLNPFALTEFPLAVTPEAAPFWEGTAGGEILLQRCVDCEARRFPARTGCPECGSLESDWTPARGEAELYSWVVVERAQLPSIQVPYAVCMVEYPEDRVRLYGSLVGDPSAFAAGLKLRVSMIESAGVFIPLFAPA